MKTLTSVSHTFGDVNLPGGTDELRVMRDLMIAELDSVIEAAGGIESAVQLCVEGNGVSQSAVLADFFFSGAACAGSFLKEGTS